MPAWDKLKRAFKDENQRALEDDVKEVPLEKSSIPWQKIADAFKDESVKVVGSDKENNPYQNDPDQDDKSKGFVAQFKRGLRR